MSFPSDELIFWVLYHGHINEENEYFVKHSLRYLEQNIENFRYTNTMAVMMYPYLFDRTFGIGSFKNPDSVRDCLRDLVLLINDKSLRDELWLAFTESSYYQKYT